MKTRIFEEILKVVSEITNVSCSDILSPKRDRENLALAADKSLRIIVAVVFESIHVRP